MSIVEPMNTTSPSRGNQAVQASARRADFQAGLCRARLQLISGAAKGIRSRSAPSSCNWPVRVIASLPVVMGSVGKRPAMVMPTAVIRRRTSPILPASVGTCDLIAMNRLAQLSARQKNASIINQPYAPIAYSLMKCHEGSRSGLITCRVASKITNMAVAASDIRAATCDETAVAGLERTVTLVMRNSLLLKSLNYPNIKDAWHPLISYLQNY